jgi:hypothetical protein
LRAADRAIGLLDRFAGCFIDRRRSELVEHAVRTLVGQRVFGIALGYEDLNDHDELAARSRHGGAGRQAGSPAGKLCAGGRQVDAQPA